MKKRTKKLVVKNPKRLSISISILVVFIVIIMIIVSSSSKAHTSQTTIETIATNKEEEKALVAETPIEKMSEKELEELENKLLSELNNEETLSINYYKLAKIRLIKGDEEKSIEYATKAIELDSENIITKISEDELFTKILDKLPLSAQSEENEKEEKEEEKQQEKKEESKKDVAQKSNPTGNTQYYIKVNYGANVVTVYTKDENGYFTVPVKAMVCSTGKATPKSGVYSIKNKWTWGKLFGNVWGHYVTKIVGNILFHSVPYTAAEPSSLEYWEYDKLGTSASMGCVRLKVSDSKWIFDNMPSGTPVEFYSDSNPGPLGKPGAQKISGNEQCRGWDPTDPDGKNPWRNLQNLEEEKKKQEDEKKKQEEENKRKQEEEKKAQEEAEKKRIEEEKKKQEEEKKKQEENKKTNTSSNNVATNNAVSSNTTPKTNTQNSSNTTIKNENKNTTNTTTKTNVVNNTTTNSKVNTTSKNATNTK